MQVGDASHRQVAVPEPVLRLAGDVGAFLAVLEFLVSFGLRLRAARVGPDPGDEGDALAVGEPLEGVDAGREVADPPRFAAVGRDDVELRRLVLAAFLLAPRDERNALAARRPRGVAILVAAARQAARAAAEGRQQPQARRALVLGHVEARDRAHRLRAVGRQRQAADALDLPQRVDVDRLVVLLVLRHQRGLVNCQRRCDFVVGHSAAVML